MEKEYPLELKEQGKASLLLVTLKHTQLDSKTTVTLNKLKRRFRGESSRNRPKISQTEDSARNLPGDLPLASQDSILRMIESYHPSDIPSVPKLNNELIEKCSKPFEKQLTASDLKDSQNRLVITKADVENFFYPILDEKERKSIAKGIEVITYGPDGKQFEMTFKIWSGKMHVLCGQWKAFYNEDNLVRHQDFVTLWMFRRLDTKKYCFVIKLRRLPVFEPFNWKRLRNN